MLSSLLHAPRVLCFTRDMALMNTRTLLLGTIGCRANGVGSLMDFRQSVSEACPDLLVLCQTLPNEERMGALEFAAQHCPHARCLIFYGSRGTSGVPYEHVSLGAGAAPQEFLDTVRRMLGRATA